MPDCDLKELSARFLLDNVHLAYQTWNESAWKESVDEQTFFNSVLPYANINERRDNWRGDFKRKFAPLVKDAKTASEAAVILNQQVFKILNVRYSTKRRKADQSPYESTESGLASCTGLSIILVDACRSVGVPARFVGTPMWSDDSGNHSWVEIWDGGWHFTGAAEPTGDKLDQAWFVGRASTARQDDDRYGIFAVSFRRTPQKFPLVWRRDADDVFAVNVTDRYVDRREAPPKEIARVMFRVLDRPEGERRKVALKIVDAGGKTVFDGTTNDERFDANDHRTVDLAENQKYTAEIAYGDKTQQREFQPVKSGQLFTWYWDPSPKEPTGDLNAAAAPTATIQALANYLSIEADKRPSLAEQPFAKTPLTRDEAAAAEKLLCSDHVRRIRQVHAAEMEARELTEGKLKMPFFYKIFGEKPAGGRSLVISMHGGGGAPARVNDQQWENQKRLYELKEGVYLAPRAPTDTWNLWHQDHIDRFFARLIENLIVFEDVDPDRVYLTGYSAGGDGVYQLAPRMADRFAAAAMMAGHPNETSPLGLRNLPFALHVGALDAAYDRNKIAGQWQTLLDTLQKGDPQGYVHSVKLWPNKGHWMDRKDAEGIAWMMQFRRNAIPEKIVWKQDDVIHDRFYWLSANPKSIGQRAELVALRRGQRIEIESKGVERIAIRLNDQMLDLDQPVVVTSGESTLFDGRPERTIGVIYKTLEERGDPKSCFAAEVEATLPVRK